MSTTHGSGEWSMYKLGRKPRSKTASKKKSQGADQLGENANARRWSAAPSSSQTAQSSSPLVPLRPARDELLQAANSLALTGSDRSCLDYLQDSALVVILGKHWPWSTLSYAYHRVAVREPMLMSMILASTASEIHRSRYHDSSSGSSPARGCVVRHDLSEVDGRRHYGRALSGLREALKQDVKSPARIEAIFITLWLMVDYENRFGNGASAISIHFHGLQTLLHNHVVPLLEQQRHHHHPGLPDGGTSSALHNRSTSSSSRTTDTTTTTAPTTIETLPAEPLPQPEVSSASGNALRYTSVPLFLLWTLYFFTPGAAFYGANSPDHLNADLFRFFLRRPEPENKSLSLTELYRISRQSPSRFWGEEYPATAQLDDMENLPGLTLYHRSHVMQFQITELFKHAAGSVVVVEKEKGEEGEGVEGEWWNEAASGRIEYDTLLQSAQSAAGVEIVSSDRRVMETIFWASITYYSTIVYFYLCCPKFDHTPSPLLSLSAAVSRVLELALKLHRSRPRLILRIVWQLFIAGIATPDKIYQDWVAIRLRELGRYGQNYSRIPASRPEMML
ncbi:hypothetical protein FE257_004215 [Aspergillus nanangensis]|uniref:EH domain-containing protein n=1 Tax=Aspergillus nanangensis TaxID=2582783 RepID=A0AAD4GV61_ASPNN|nr:hypothetical protein FE257_004215 [Aspergillus nanangensis]